jgi:hypothetical protein
VIEPSYIEITQGKESMLYTQFSKLILVLVHPPASNSEAPSFFQPRLREAFIPGDDIISPIKIALLLTIQNKGGCDRLKGREVLVRPSRGRYRALK